MLWLIATAKAGFGRRGEIALEIYMRLGMVGRIIV